MNTFLIGLAILLTGGLLAVCVGRANRLANAVGAFSAAAGSMVAFWPAWSVVSSGQSLSYGPRVWNVPYGSFVLQLNPLSAWFALPIAGLSTLAAIYGYGYMRHYADTKRLGPPWFFYNLLIAGMLLVVASRNGVLFLVAWEVMSLASYFLVVFEHEKAEVREAGKIYLIATHLGTAFLLVLFALLGKEAGSLDFADIAAHGPIEAPLAGPLFLMAVVGFGTKAGFLPLHVWLPEAHPYAPSHSLAVMSGAMIKTGIYGIVLTLGFLGPPPVWWGWLLIAIGVVSSTIAVIYALVQDDLKRLLAYSSAENVGIITLGLGVGLLGISLKHPELALLGLAGALLHVLNHAVFKGLLFLAAGGVLHATGSSLLDELGGLQKRTPLLAALFLVGAVAISGLPPLNGFMSEFLIYLASFDEEIFLTTAGSVPSLAVIGSLALVGGLAAACFTRAFGVVFLGAPRSQAAHGAQKVSVWMLAPMTVLAFLCLAVGLRAPAIVGSLKPVLTVVTRETPEQVAAQLAGATVPLSSVVVGAVALLVLVGVLAIVRLLLLAGRAVETSETWGCGYARPTARMQYTASSFAQPIAWFFSPLLQVRRQLEAPEGLFPQAASFRSETPDGAMRFVYRPLFLWGNRLLATLQWIQHGRVNFYVMYIALAMIVLLAWFLGSGP